MNVVECMRAFRAVAEVGSFAAAGRSLRISTAWVSARVAQLEAHLGAQLLVRTTRRVAPTDAGRVYLERCVKVLDDLEAAERTVAELQSSPRGRLRVSAPMSFGILRVAPLLATFRAAYPEVEVDVVFDDRVTDLVEGGIDVAVRIGASLRDSSLVAKALGTGERFVCASPSYLRARGTPRHPRDLVGHDCLHYVLHATPGRWSFVGPDGTTTVDVEGRVRANNSIALAAAALAGAGIVLVPDFVVERDLATGALQRVLSAYRPSAYRIFAVSPPARFVSPKVRAFVDCLSKALRESRGLSKAKT